MAGMLGAFRSSLVAFGGYLNKVSWRLSPTRKANQRKRLQLVDENVQAIRSVAILRKDTYVRPEGKEQYFKKLLPTPYNKKGYKGIHKTPHFTKLPRDFEDRHNK